MNFYKKLDQLLNDLEDYPDSRMEIIQDMRRVLRNQANYDKVTQKELEIKEALLRRSKIYHRRAKSLNRRAKNTVNKTERDKLIESVRKHLKISQDYFNAATSYGKSDSGTESL